MPTAEYPDTVFGRTPRAYGTGRDGKGVCYSVIHYTAGSESRTSAEGGNAYDSTRTDGTSCHVFHDPDSSVQEVLRKDRANSAFHKGNRLGIQHELCGTAQTRAQWLDAASDAILWRAARAVAKDCVDYNLEPRRLSVAETRAAWYSYPHGPRGIVGHVDITLAYPEDGGNHTDPGTGFPWDVFLARVRQFITNPQGVDMSERLEWMAHCFEYGLETVPDGPVEGREFAVMRQIRRIAADVAELKARPTSVVGLSDEARDAIVAQLRAEVDGIVEAALRRVLLDAGTPGDG